MVDKMVKLVINKLTGKNQFAKNLIEVLKYNNCVTWKKSFAMFL
jgi:hypothetical protein